MKKEIGYSTIISILFPAVLAFADYRPQVNISLPEQRYVKINAARIFIS